MSEQDLAAQVQSLTRQVEELSAVLHAVARGVAGEVEGLAEKVDELTERVQQQEPAASLAPAASAPAASSGSGDPDEQAAKRPTAWVDYAEQHDWHHLADWVDWLHRTYDMRPNVAVPSCWPAHTGVVEELAALWAAWREAAVQARPPQEDDGTVRPGEQADGSALVYWHDRWLHPMLGRIRALYQISNCQQKHDKLVGAKSTSRELLDEAVRAARQRPARNGERAQQPALPCDANTGELLD